MSQDVLNCPACARRTPSARATCLYCGATLPVTEIESAPSQRNIDTFEPAFNTVLEPAFQGDAQQEAALASALKLDATEAREMLALGKRLPVARSQTRQEADMIAALIRSRGMRAGVVADEELRLQHDLVRARRIEAEGGAFHIRHSGGSLSVESSEVRLMVLGGLKNRRVDYTESGLARSSAVLDSSEFFSNEALLDVYSSTVERSFRIKSDAVDYSGLVERPSMRAEENFRLLVARLRELAPQAKLDEDFARVRHLLGRAWPERSRTEARGVKRKGLALRPVARSSVISDNRDQFDRYSRLMFISEVK